MSDANKALLRRWVDEGFNKGNVGIVDELYDAEVVYRGASLAELRGVEALKAMIASFLAAFPGSRLTIEEQVAEGDSVVTRCSFVGTQEGEFMGVAPTGRQVRTSGVVFDRIAGGKIVEEWELIDIYGMLRQLGAVPQAKGEAAG